MFDVFYKDQINSIEDACKLSRTRYLWVLDQHNDYSDFDLAWEPPPWESNQIHIWPSQHQEHGGTMLIPKQGATEKNYNHHCISRTKGAHRLHIKHTASSKDEGDVNTRYISNYMDTMRRALRKTDWEYCWVTADICTYTDFDFTWHPSEWQQDMLHVFASNEQKFGDTFYVHVPSFLEKTENLEVLEWFETLHFVENIRVKRYIYDTVQYTSDSLVNAVWNHNFEQPVALFYRGNKMVMPPTISLWQERTKTVVPLSEGGECTLVPRESKNYLQTQIYDYPWIDKTKKNLIPGDVCDVVFISNGESMAERHWQILKDICPRAKRINGVDGRDRAYKAAAELSDTDWFYAVFAKTEVLPTFKFDFVADRLQQPKHYIFYSRNALNGLEYGSMNIDLYNKQLVLDTHIEEGSMLDFTLSKLHAVIPVTASIAQFNTDPWVTWRSAFREVIKLQQEVDAGAGPEIQYRLKVWCERANGANADYCLAGANDALEFYHSVDADPKELQKSFHWEWIKQWYYNKYQREIWLEVV
jgi:hypothetical protein